MEHSRKTEKAGDDIYDYRSCSSRGRRVERCIVHERDFRPCPDRIERNEICSPPSERCGHTGALFKLAVPCIRINFEKDIAFTASAMLKNIFYLRDRFPDYIHKLLSSRVIRMTRAGEPSSPSSLRGIATSI